LLKEYPKKFALKNNVVIFLESYNPSVARMKMKYLVEQGLYAYFSHKVDECGVHFFDPLYYEETEPFHANLRMVTNIYNNQRIKLVPAFFKKYRNQFQYKQISPYLVAISKVETEIVTGVTGIVVAMFDKKYGLIKFNRNTESCLALFSANALYQNGYKITADPKSLPPVFFDAYKVPENERGDKFKWFACLTWVGRRPNPKFGATKDELFGCPHYKSSVPQGPIDHQVRSMKAGEAVDYMKMGLVKEVRRNGAVVHVKEEGEDKEQRFFIPGWSFTHTNSPKVKFLTTTQGVGLSVGDLVNFYIDPNMTAKPYDAVACNVDVLKHADFPTSATSVKKVRKRSTMSTSSGKPSPMSWKNFLMKAEIEEEEASEGGDPNWEPPENYEDSDFDDSVISEDEIADLVESLKSEVRIAEIYPEKDELQVDEKTETANKMGKEEAIIKASDVNPNSALAPPVVEA